MFRHFDKYRSVTDGDRWTNRQTELLNHYRALYSFARGHAIKKCIY